jgi:MFS family permease
MTNPTAVAIDKSQQRLGPIWLSAGVTRRNALTMFYSSAMAIGFVNLLNLIQPLLLQDQLGMTEGEGNFTAMLFVILELITLTVAAPLANLSDVIGRRPIFTSGFIIICLALIMLPAASSGFELGAIRAFASLGIACCTTMIASVTADYPQNATRGKFISANGMCTALGVIIVGSGLTQMPSVFSNIGYSSTDAIAFTIWIGATLAIITAWLAWSGLRRGRVTEVIERPGFLANARTGLGQIKNNPRLVLGCGATLMSRGDLTVLATFFALWVQKVGADQNIESVIASGTAGRLFGLMQICMLLSLPIMGILADRVNRVSIVAIAMAAAAIGYFALGISPNPFESNWIYPVVALAGIGEAGMIIAVPSLIGQEAPAESRGAIIGIAATCGALGIIMTNWVAGLMFDNLSYQAPFLFMAVLNCCMLSWALIVRMRTTMQVVAT